MASIKEPAPLADRITTLAERSNKLWLESMERSVDDARKLKPDPLNALPAIQKLAHNYFDHPQKLAEAYAKYWAEQADLWTRAAQKAMGIDVPPMIEPDKGDKRFKDDTWSDTPVYDYLKQSYLLTARWLKSQLADAEGLNLRDKRKLELLTRNLIEAISPTNSPVTNPEVLRTTLDEQGDNLLRGLENLVRDLERGHGHLMISQTDLQAFKVGENMAVTPGAVVFQNDVMQLIQYAPTTEEVHATPLLIVPPWINKFYILDLNQKKSMIQWLVAQGHTVFVLSWVNPADEHRDETWESYMLKGVVSAIDKVLEETGAPKTNVVGYCIGGTMLGCTLAWMAAKNDDRIATATFFTAQLEFSDAGELQAFVDEEVIDTVEKAAADHGYLDAENMAGAFNSLRATDLIWSFVINNYLMGRDNFPFDLLYWNSDSTCMPGRVHTFYLDTFYNQNLLAKGKLELAGVRLDLKKVILPVYHVAAREDHIAPAPSAFRAAKCLGSRRQRFILAGSGHIAGVVNPPSMKKYQYWTKTGLKGNDLSSWLEETNETEGSWWPDWNKWLAKHGGGMVPAREPGAVLGQLEAAPGSYVKDRSDQR